MMLHSVRWRLRQTLMEDMRRTLVSLERRKKFFSQQQFIFVSSLERCRLKNFEPTKPISTVAQVQNYKDEVTDNATDKRIFAIFLSLVYDLDEFRRNIEKLAVTSFDRKLHHILKTWKNSLHPRQDVSNIRAKFPNDQVNHLSCDEAKNHFGGIVSLIPFAMDRAKEAVGRLEALTSSHDIVPPNYNGSDPGSRDDVLRRVRPHSANPRMVTPGNDPYCGSAGERISTPVPRRPRSPSLSSRRSASAISQVSSLRTRSQSGKRPSSAYPTSYVSKGVQTTDSLSNVRRSELTGKAVQTPNYLSSTLKPQLNWAHQTLSESEIRKVLKSRRGAGHKPGWKP